jgi:CheY-like chemotaxis protein
MHVLLVEDDETTRLLLAAQLRAGSPDVIVSDVNLPGMSGIEFTSSLRQELGPERLGVVLISGDSSAAVDGADAFLAKPFRQQELLTAVHVARPARR